MKRSTRIIAVILTFAIVFSLATPSLAASDASSGSVLVDSVSLSSWNTYLDNRVVDGLDLGGAVRPGFWKVLDNAFADSGLGAFDSLEKLSNAAVIWPRRAEHHEQAFGLFFAVCLVGGKIPEAVVANVNRSVE